MTVIGQTQTTQAFTVGAFKGTFYDNGQLCPFSHRNLQTDASATCCKLKALLTRSNFPRIIKRADAINVRYESSSNTGELCQVQKQHDI